ncbi:MAG: CBS domain-containing protein [Firmicutes bacterium]|nr:CBS domain-containing protein [Bacillota bacterium]
MLIREVKEWMQTFPAKVHYDATVAEARDLMLESKFGRILVVDREDRLMGILTDSDVLAATDHSVKVETIMTPVVVSVYENQTIRDAGRLLVENKIAGVPVVDSEGRVVGLLTARDILRGYLAEEDEVRLSMETLAINLAMTRHREDERYWLDRSKHFGYRAAITQVGAGPDKLATKLRESTIAAAIARKVISEDSREKIAVSQAVRDAFFQLSLINPGLGGGFKVSAVRGDGRITVVIFGRFGHALADGPEQIAVGYSVI